MTDLPWNQLADTYDVVAPTYEATFAEELGSKPRDRALLTAFAAAVSDPVIELGCGPGHVGGFVRDEGHRVVGLDVSAGMALLAGRRLDGVVRADMRALPFGDASAGGVVAFYSLIHLPRLDLVGAWREIARVLRPGGAALVAVHEGEGEFERGEFMGEAVPFVASLFQLEEMTDAVVAAGMEVVLAERRSPYPGEFPTDRLYVQARR